VASDVEIVDASFDGFMYVTRDGTAYAQGKSREGRFGGTSDYYSSPRKVMNGVKHISLTHSFALLLMS